MLRPVVISLTCIGLLAACSAGPTEEELAQITLLQADLAEIEAELLELRDETAEEGGLVGALLKARLETSELTRDLLAQRIVALESGAPVTSSVLSVLPDDSAATALMTEIATQREAVARAEGEASAYGSGSLLHGLGLMSVATEKMTLAMLRQRYLAAKYGLVAPSIEWDPGAGASSSGTGESAADMGSGLPRVTPMDECLEIDEFDSSEIDRNNVYVEMSWKVDLSNSCDRPMTVRTTFTFYDADDFVLDSDFEYVNVPPNGVGRARGTLLVSPVQTANRIARQGVQISGR